MKLCFSTLGCCDYSMDEVILLAKAYAITGLEIRGLNGTLNNAEIRDLSAENIWGTKKKVDDAGLELAVLGTSCSFHDPGQFESMTGQGKAEINLAANSGFGAIRVFGNSIVGDESQCIDRVNDGIRRLCEFALGKGVDVLLEVHGDFNTPRRLFAVTEACKEYDNFGLIWDVYHTRNTYKDAWQNFCKDFFPYIRHVHLKDCVGDVPVLPGEGELPLLQIVNKLTDLGYEGYFSLEWEKKWYPQLAPIEQALECFVQIFR